MTADLRGPASVPRDLCGIPAAEVRVVRAGSLGDVADPVLVRRGTCGFCWDVRQANSADEVPPNKSSTRGDVNSLLLLEPVDPITTKVGVRSASASWPLRPGRSRTRSYGGSQDNGAR